MARLKDEDAREVSKEEIRDLKENKPKDMPLNTTVDEIKHRIEELAAIFVDEQYDMAYHKSMWLYYGWVRGKRMSRGEYESALLEFKEVF